MKFRIVKANGLYEIEGKHERGLLMKLFLGEHEWEWIHTYETLEDASRAKARLEGNAPPGDREVVG